MPDVYLKATFKGTSSLVSPLTEEATCVMPISVGWDYHEGDLFKATLKLAEKNFSFCRIVVADTLQRHSLQFLKSSLENCYNDFNHYARCLGDEWIKRHITELENMSINYKIERWDQYIYTKEYENTKKKIEDVLNLNKEFKEYFYISANNTYSNFKKNGKFGTSIVNKDNFINASVQYLIEESAVTILWGKYNETILLYPKGLGDALNKIMDLFLGEKRKFLQHLQIKTKRPKNGFIASDDAS
jgi:hypothetical protein